MASTDIDGSVIVILSTEEAQWVHQRLIAMPTLDETGQKILHKIIRDLGLKQSDETSEANQDDTTATESSPPWPD